MTITVTASGTVVLSAGGVPLAKWPAGQHGAPLAVRLDAAHRWRDRIVATGGPSAGPYAVEAEPRSRGRRWGWVGAPMDEEAA